MTPRLITLLLLVLLCLPQVAASADSADNGSPAEDSRYGSVEERRLLLALQQERRNLAKEREALEKQKKDLKRLEAEVDKKLDQLRNSRLQIEQLLAEKDAAELKKIRNLGKMYEKMTPEKAARIFSTLDQELAISILENMKTKAAAKVLNNMDRDKAANLTTAFSTLD